MFVPNKNDFTGPSKRDEVMAKKSLIQEFTHDYPKEPQSEITFQLDDPKAIQIYDGVVRFTIPATQCKFRYTGVKECDNDSKQNGNPRNTEYTRTAESFLETCIKHPEWIKYLTDEFFVKYTGYDYDEKSNRMTVYNPRVDNGATRNMILWEMMDKPEAFQDILEKIKISIRLIPLTIFETPEEENESIVNQNVTTEVNLYERVVSSKLFSSLLHSFGEYNPFVTFLDIKKNSEYYGKKISFKQVLDYFLMFDAKNEPSEISKNNPNAQTFHCKSRINESLNKLISLDKKEGKEIAQQYFVHMTPLFPDLMHLYEYLKYKYPFDVVKILDEIGRDANNNYKDENGEYIPSYQISVNYADSLINSKARRNIKDNPALTERYTARSCETPSLILRDNEGKPFTKSYVWKDSAFRFLCISLRSLIRENENASEFFFMDPIKFIQNPEFIVKFCDSMTSAIEKENSGKNFSSHEVRIPAVAKAVYNSISNFAILEYNKIKKSKNIAA